MPATLGPPIAPGRTYEEAIAVLNTTDPTVTGVPLVGATVALILSLAPAGPAIAGCSFAASDSGSTMTGTDGVVRQKYLATIDGSVTRTALAPYVGQSVYQYATVNGEPLDSDARLVDPSV